MKYDKVQLIGATKAANRAVMGLLMEYLKAGEEGNEEACARYFDSSIQMLQSIDEMLEKSRPPKSLPEPLNSVLAAIEVPDYMKHNH